MKQEFIDIIKYKLFNKLLLNKELKKKILKSIIQNNLIKYKIKIISQIKLQKLVKSKTSNKRKNICLLTGKKKSIYNFSNLSRHSIKKLNILSLLQNVKLKSW